MKKMFLKSSSMLFLCFMLFSAFKSYKADEQMNAAYFKTHTGLITFFSQDFDFDISCSIQTYELIHQPKKQDPSAVKNQGGNFGAETMRLIQLAKPGDTYIFREIKARCPGDKAARSLPSLVVMIK